VVLEITADDFDGGEFDAHGMNPAGGVGRPSNASATDE
jgi:hypothetical protein